MAFGDLCEILPQLVLPIGAEVQGVVRRQSVRAMGKLAQQISRGATV
jgi:hypothetical protein